MTDENKVLFMEQDLTRIGPDTFRGFYMGQRYTIRYNPATEEWDWEVHFTRSFDFVGSGSTKQQVKIAAIQQVKNLMGNKV